MEAVTGGILSAGLPVGACPRHTTASNMLTIVSRSAEIRLWSRAMLISVGLDPDSLSEIDAAVDGWRDRLVRNAFVVADVIAARELPAGCQPRVFRVIADSSLAELKQFCGL